MSNEIKSKIEQIDFPALINSGTSEYCEIAPGVVEIVKGVQMIVDNYVSGSTKDGIDFAFGALILALQAPCG